MITIIFCPKLFSGHFEIIQKNAIKSWTLLNPRPEIILFGNEKGVKEVCEEFGLIHVDDVEVNQYGTPLISDIFYKGQTYASNDIICYVNADIIFMNDLMKSVERVSKVFTKYMILGRRWDLNILSEIRFEDDWQDSLISKVKREGVQQRAEAIDYFVFPKGTINNLLNFAVGRPRWDNWMIWKAKSERIPVIDASITIMAVHQNHDYSHHPQNYEGVWSSSEAVTNYELSGDILQFYKIIDADFILEHDRIVRNISWEHYHWIFVRRKLWLQDKLRIVGKIIGFKRMKNIISKCL